MSNITDSPPAMGLDRSGGEVGEFFKFDKPSTPAVTATPTSSFPPPPPTPPAGFVPPQPASQVPSSVAEQHAPPQLPKEIFVPAPVAVIPTAAASPLYIPPVTPTPPKKKRRFKKFVGYVLILAILAGLVAAGITYGPELMTLAQGDEASDEPSAPLEFPVATSELPVVRTATFSVQTGADSNGSRNYQVTTDFETGISQIIIDRVDQPRLEILTIFDGAIIRRTDETTWYRLDRGEFPIDRELGRERWVRTLDEFLPEATRRSATIESASESMLAEEPMRRLTVSIDPNQLMTTPPAKLSPIEIGAPDPNPVTDVPAAGDQPQQDPAASAQVSGDEVVVEGSPLPSGKSALPPGLILGTDAAGEVPVSIELWVDKTGTIRRLILPAELGGETVTVDSTSPDAWQPLFPPQDMVKPLTASALFGLGL